MNPREVEAAILSADHQLLKRLAYALNTIAYAWCMQIDEFPIARALLRESLEAVLQ